MHVGDGSDPGVRFQKIFKEVVETNGMGMDAVNILGTFHVHSRYKV